MIWLSRQKQLLKESGNMSLFDLQNLKKWMERTKSTKLSSDLYICTVTYAPNAIHTHMHNKWFSQTVPTNTWTCTYINTIYFSFSTNCPTPHSHEHVHGCQLVCIVENHWTWGYNVGFEPGTCAVRRQTFHCAISCAQGFSFQMSLWLHSAL